MLTIRPTKMLARQLGLTVPATMPAVPSRVADWCVHGFIFQRRRWLIFCNTASLYPVLAHAQGVTDGEALARRVGGMVQQVLEANADPDLARTFASALSDYQWAPIPSRSILGSMNDLISLAEARIGDPNLTPATLSRQLGTAPMSALGMNHPAHALATLRT